MGTLGMQTPWALQGPFWWAPSLWNLLRWGAEWGPSQEPGTGVARMGSWALESRPCVGRMTSNGVTNPAGSAWWDHPPLSRAQSPGCLPAPCIVWLWQGDLGGWSAPGSQALLAPWDLGSHWSGEGRRGHSGHPPSARTLHPNFSAPAGRGGPGLLSLA